MKKNISEYLDKVFELDKYVEDGVYCDGLNKEDMRAFEEHAKKRKQKKDK